MRVTFWAAGLPLALLLLQYALRDAHGQAPLGAGAVVLTTGWFFAGAFVTIVYWFVRLVRHAWRG